MVRTGAMRRLAPGYYVLTPGERLRDPSWRAPVEDVALAIAIADYGLDAVALMGISAARQHGAFPRAVATGLVAAPRQRPPLATPFGQVVFVRRSVATLDVVRTKTSLAEGWVTSPEQTVLDIADRPKLGDIAGRDAAAIIAALAPTVDWDRTAELAERQRKSGALARARWIASAVVRLPQAARPRRLVRSAGLRPRSPSDPEPFGVVLEPDDAAEGRDADGR